MGHEMDLSGPQSEAQLEHQQRMAELYANIALTDIFLHGAAVTSQGVLHYPFFTEQVIDTMSTEHADLHSKGRIVRVRPDEIRAEVTDPSHPPIIFVIPPRSVERMAIKEYSRYKRPLKPAVMLYHGVDENGRPVTNSINGEYHLMEGLKAAILVKMTEHGIDPKSTLKKAPKAIVNEVLVNIANTIGQGNINEAVARSIAEISQEQGIAVSVAEDIINGGREHK